MRWVIFCASLFILLLNTGIPAFAKSRNVTDNTRYTDSKACVLAQQVQRQAHKIGSAVDQELSEKLLFTTDEEDDLPISAPARKQLQSILAYFLSAYLSTIDRQFSNCWQLSQEKPVLSFNRNELCVFRI